MVPTPVSTDRLVALAPRLPSNAPLVVFDDVCVLCSGFVQWVMARDGARRFWFTSAQGPIGQHLYGELGLDPVDFETNLLVADGIAYGKLDAFIEVTWRLGGVWRLFRGLYALPRPLRNALYDRIARNRYRVFGKRAACWMPAPGLMDRVV